MMAHVSEVSAIPSDVPADRDGPPRRGERQRRRTRERLVATALEVVAEQGEGYRIDDVVARAGVSHGTFYNYFADRDALLDAVVAQLVETFAAEQAVAVTDGDPVARFATITAVALATVDRAPQAARVALRLESIQRDLPDGGPFRYLRADLEAGHAAGRFTAAPDDATLDVVVGSLLAAARRIATGRHDTDYRRAVIRRLLVALGIADEEAERVAADAVATSVS